MSAALLNLQAAQRDAIASDPESQGFPCLAETLRRAGVRTNTVVAAIDAKPLRDRRGTLSGGVTLPLRDDRQ